jgi:aryl-phospho-beta-D-glucosidase BglC (GH1 family)
MLRYRLVIICIVVGASVGVTACLSSNAYVTVCGTSLCASGSTWLEKGATAYGLYASPSTLVSDAQVGKLNAVELVEFDTQYHQLSDTESAATWNRLDQVIGAANKAGIYVILNLSEFGQSLQAAGLTMASANWQSEWNQYLTFIADRTNTVTGVLYKNDPTIAMVELWGEIPAPNNSGAVGTGAQMQQWYSTTMAEWHSLAPKILVSSGGFSYLNESGAAGIPWQQIMSNANDATCDIEVNSSGDRNTTVPMVTKYCKSIGKPWFLSAWSSCDKASRSSTDLDDFSTDAQMALHAQDMYNVSYGQTPATYAALGTDFWNLGPTTSNTCQLGPQFPKTWAIVQGAS